MKKLSTLIIALACTAVPCYAAQGEVPVIENPVLWADVPDPDVISVGDDFYMVSTTMPPHARMPYNAFARPEKLGGNQLCL